MRKLVLANCRVEFGTFKVVISDLPTSNDFTPSTSPHIVFSFIVFLISVSVAKDTWAAKLKKKKAITAASAQKLGNLTQKNKRTAKWKRISTFLFILMELIKPDSKRKVRVTSIAAEIMPLRCMRRAKVDDEL